jgi:hypothetical protein
MMSPIRQNAVSDSFNEIATIRIELRHTDPLIWRQVEVPTSITLKVLHDIIQAVMGWFDYHLWEFTIGKQKYGLPMDDDWGTEPRIAAGKVRLRDVLKPRKTVIDYTAPAHRDRCPHRPAGRLLSALHRWQKEWTARGGGIPGFYELLEAITDPAHPSHAHLKEWAGDYDPDTVDALPIKYALGRIANRRNAAKARLAKKKHFGSAT